jgi:putative transposase
MAYKNTRRQDYEKSFYHVYNRGIAKMDIFLDEEDHRVFERLLARSLSKEKTVDKYSREYSNYYGLAQLHVYCLMPNHFHFLFYQEEPGAIEKVMHGVNVAYSMYFNKKYQRRGTLYESPYKSVLISSDDQLKHVSRYIHLNPMGYRLWGHSSYSDYVYDPRNWVTTEYILNLFSSKKAYLDFVDDYEDTKRKNDLYKAKLGDI